MRGGKDHEFLYSEGHIVAFGKEKVKGPVRLVGINLVKAERRPGRPHKAVADKSRADPVVCQSVKSISFHTGLTAAGDRPGMLCSIPGIPSSTVLKPAVFLTATAPISRIIYSLPVKSPSSISPGI